MISPLTKITRKDIAKILSDIGKPGERQAEKIEAIRALGLSNTQNHGVELTLETFGEF